MGFSVVGFGGRDNLARPHIVTSGNRIFSTAEHTTTTLKTSYQQNGEGVSDIYSALKYTVDRLPYRPGASKTVVLVTCDDEGRHDHAAAVRRQLAPPDPNGRPAAFQGFQEGQQGQEDHLEGPGFCRRRRHRPRPQRGWTRAQQGTQATAGQPQGLSVYTGPEQWGLCPGRKEDGQGG